jgi:hypothetical protein
VTTVITADDVRRLLDSDEVEPVLVLADGAISVVASAAIDSDAVVVADRGLILRELPGLAADPGEFALVELASRLNVEITELGG